MRSLFLFFSLLTFSFYSFSQSTAKNSLYLELGGAAGLYSINYERMISEGSNVDINARIGFAVVPFRDREVLVDWDIDNIAYAFPIGVNFVFGDKKNHFETGLAYSIVFDGRVAYDGYAKTNGEFIEIVNLRVERGVGHYLIPKIGYRYQKAEGGLIFKVNATPFIIIDDALDSSSSNTNRVLFWLGVSVGKAF